ncbi:hypothetical protein Bca4012_058856 [Brassica carinata]
MDDCRIEEDQEPNVTEGIIPIPEMMFAAGHEPVGVRVLTYQSSTSINQILESLEDEEIQRLRMSPFGKIVEIAEKPCFSGRFVRFMLSRQLKVEKKHEAWFRFAGKPIRFSIREFAIVTGLNCGDYPKKPKLKSKKKRKAKPYWPELFGRTEDLRVSTALKMLRRKTVSDKEVRIKLACLAIVSSVLLSTNLKMKMIKEHAEALVDLDEFFSFPWGRLAFDMLMGNIKQRDEVSLSNDTNALKGFALALQLVIVEAVPALTEVVLESCSSSESDSSDDGDDFIQKKNKQKTLSPGHARELDKQTDVIVTSIIPEDPDRPLAAETVVYGDEVLDVNVENLLKLITESYSFTAEMFKGGATKLDVERMREIPADGGKRRRKTKALKHKETDEEKRIAAIVLSMLQPEVQRVDANVGKAFTLATKTVEKVDSLETRVKASIQNQLKNFKEEVIRSVMEIHNKANATTPAPPASLSNLNTEPRKADNVIPPTDANDAAVSRSPVPETENNGSRTIIGAQSKAPNQDLPTGSANSQTNIPLTTAVASSSLCLTDELNPPPPVPGWEAMTETVSEHGQEDSNEDPYQPLLWPKTKRAKMVPSGLENDSQSGVDILSLTRDAQPPFAAYSDPAVVMSKYTKLVEKISKSFVINVAGLAVTSKDLTGIVELSRSLPARAVDILVRFIRTTYNRDINTRNERNPQFLDTRYVALLCKHFPKFERSKSPDSYHFPKDLVDYFGKDDATLPPLSHYYFPFDLGNKQWVGVCFDCSTRKITVLDCNIAVRTDSEMVEHLNPFTHMIPSLLKRTGRVLSTDGDVEVVIDRPTLIHQNTNPSHLGLTSILLMQSHAMFGLDGCRCITPTLLSEEAHRIVVMLYDYTRSCRMTMCLSSLFCVFITSILCLFKY